MAVKCARGLFGPNRAHIIDHKDLIFRIFAGLFFEIFYAEGPLLTKKKVSDLDRSVISGGEERFSLDRLR